MKFNRLHIVLLSIITAFVMVYFGYLHNLIAQYLISTQRNWLSALLEFWYPQLPYLKNAIAPSVLLQRANQCVYRLVFLSATFLFISSKKDFFKTCFIKYSYNTKHIILFTSIFYGYAMFTFLDWWKEIDNIKRLEVFYNPIFPLSIFSSSLLPSTFYYTALIVGSSCCLLTLWLKNNRLKCISAGLGCCCLMFMHATFCGFGKMDHGYASFFYVGMLLPFYFLWRKTTIIRFAQVVVTLCYCMAGLEKLFLSGIHFINPVHFTSLLQLHPTPWAIWLSNQPLLCFVIPLLTILVQLGAPLIFLHKQLVLPWFIGAVLFHWGAYFFMGVGGYHSPWVFALSVFIPLLFERKEIIGLSTTSSKKGENEIE